LTAAARRIESRSNPTLARCAGYSTAGAYRKLGQICRGEHLLHAAVATDTLQEVLIRSSSEHDSRFGPLLARR
jgi:hypothetical protein